MTTKNDIKPEDILARLKRETAEIHLATENRMPFGAEDFSLADYQRLLVGFYDFYRDCEPSIEDALHRYSVNFDYRARLKTSKLAIDLRNLDVSLSPISNSSAASQTAAFNSAEKLFGALYVIEGSTLGGQVISRMLKSKFDLDESNGAAFFNGYGANTGARWNEFRATITKFAAASDHHGEIVAAAAETFERIGRTISNR